MEGIWIRKQPHPYPFHLALNKPMKRFSDLSWLIVAAISLSASLGCSSDEVAAPDIAKQTQSLDEAASKIAAKDFSGAKEIAAAVLQGAGLSADQAEEATMILIESAIETGDLDTAETYLSQAEISATDMGRVFVFKGLLLRKKGDEAKAQEAFQQARAHDPNVVVPG